MCGTGVPWKAIFKVRSVRVVIADQSVANVYADSLKSGLSISYSQLSDKGAAEFAKRFRVRGLSRDWSPLSINNLLHSHHPCGLMAVHMTS